MTVQQIESYMDHPMFQVAMTSMQKGEWEAGLTQLERLSQAYPLESELRGLRTEMQLRASIDEYERRIIPASVAARSKTWPSGGNGCFAGCPDHLRSDQLLAGSSTSSMPPPANRCNISWC